MGKIASGTLLPREEAYYTLPSAYLCNTHPKLLEGVAGEGRIEYIANGDGGVSKRIERRYPLAELRRWNATRPPEDIADIDSRLEPLTPPEPEPQPQPEPVACAEPEPAQCPTAYVAYEQFETMFRRNQEEGTILRVIMGAMRGRDKIEIVNADAPAGTAPLG